MHQVNSGNSIVAGIDVIPGLLDGLIIVDVIPKSYTVGDIWKAYGLGIIAFDVSRHTYPQIYRGHVDVKIRGKSYIITVASPDVEGISYLSDKMRRIYPNISKLPMNLSINNWLTMIRWKRQAIIENLMLRIQVCISHFHASLQIAPLHLPATIGQCPEDTIRGDCERIEAQIPNCVICAR